MTNNQSLTIKLTQEELLLILMRYRMPLMPGINPELTQLKQDQLELLMGAAERSLLAREYLKTGPDGKPNLEPVVLAIVAACAKPEKTVVMLKMRADQKNETLTFNFARQMVVVQVPLPPGIHQFTALPNGQAAVNLSLTLMKAEGEAKNALPVGEVSEAVLNQARELASAKRVDEAAAALEKELQPASARELAQALCSPVAETTLAAITGLTSDHSSQAGGFSVLEGSQAAFILTPLGESEQRKVSVQPATPDAIRKALKQLM